MSGVTVKLSKPIKAHNEELRELTMREPTGDDLIDIGYPYIILMPEGSATGIQIKPGAIYSYVSRLAGIPLSSAKQISLSDLAQVQGVIMNFFGEGNAETSEST